VTGGEPARCGRCGAALSPDDAAHGTCPSCLIGLGLDVGTEETTHVDPRPRPGHPERVGRYRILDLLGEGGMGVVYLAEQTEPIRRRVALKLIKLGMDSGQVIARFESERQALALMNHPNVAKVHDAGVGEDGRPYFVMEYVAGIPITAYCDLQRLDVRERLALFLQTCDALQHAHQKGIIHRDIKPANVLVAVEDERPTVRVIDFGVAKATSQKLTERTVYTQQGVVIGTPEYMSPEQAGVTALDVDTRADIYSLGVLLYELLVGALPFDPKKLRAVSDVEWLRIIREDEPPRPTTRIVSLGDTGHEVARRRRTDLTSLTQQIRGELEWITVRAMEKDPARRYPSASELAADIRRYLSGEAVLARPPTLGYQLRIFARKNRVLFAATAIVFLVLLGGIVVSTSMYLRSQRAERVSRIEAQKAEAVSGFLRKMLSSANPSTARGRELTVREVLDEASRTVETELAGQPEVQDAVRYTIAETYKNLGLGEAGIPHMTWVHDFRRRTLGDGDERTMLALRQLGIANLVAGRHDETVRIYREALEISRRSRGEEHPRTIDAMAMYGNSLKNQGALTEAEPYLVRATEVGDRVVRPGDDDNILVVTHLSLGHLYLRQGRFREGRPQYERAIENATKMWGEDTMWTLRVWNEATALHVRAGWLLRAEEMIDETIVRARRGLGERHPVTAWAVANQASLFQARGNPAESEARFRAALAILDQADPEHPQRPEFMSGLTSVLIEQGKIEEARAVTRDRLAIARRRSEHAAAGSEALAGLAQLLLTCQPPDLRDPAAALPLAEKAVALSGRKIPTFLDTLGQAYEMTGDLDKAIQVQREAVALLPVRWTIQRQEIEGRLVKFLEEKGENRASEDALRQTLSRRREGLPASHPDIALALIALGQALARHGNRSEGIPLLREALTIRRTVLPADDWEISHAAVLLGRVLVEERAFGEAETLLLEAHAALADERGVPAAPRREARRSLVALYEAWGKRNQAARFNAPEVVSEDR